LVLPLSARTIVLEPIVVLPAPLAVLGVLAVLAASSCCRASPALAAARGPSR